MKKILKKINLSRLVLAGLIIFIVVRRGPEVLKNFRHEQQIFPQQSLYSLSNTPFTFPPSDGRRSAALFWTTWCGPCKLEMELIKRSIVRNKIPAERIFAIHIEGSAEEVTAHIRKYEFHFPALIDARGSLASTLEVSSTPTLFLINEKGRIEWASSGIGPTDIFRIERFFTAPD